jgi:tetratricopeptide (TPR) repeat protein
VIVRLQLTLRRAACLVILAVTTSGQFAGQTSGAPSIPALLDRYQQGDFDAAVQAVSAADVEQVRAPFIAAADAWLARDAGDIINRRLVATAFATEVAHARLPYDNLTLMVLLDWARQEWHKGPPTPAEGVWTRAAVALIERGGRMSAGRPAIRPGGEFTLTSSRKFLKEAFARFPEDPRLQLAEVAWLPKLELFLATPPPPRARTARGLERLTGDRDVGPAALVELGYLKFEDKDFESARRLTTQAASDAKEPWTRYLAHFLGGVIAERQGRFQDALREYVAALEDVPHAQSATIALVPVLLRSNQADAAFELVRRSLSERPNGDDPWRLFDYGDYVRWPVLIADVRKAIH